VAEQLPSLPNVHPAPSVGCDEAHTHTAKAERTRVASVLDVVGREPTSGEVCTANLEASRLLDGLRPALIAMILGKQVPFYHVDHVSPAGLVQVVVTRTVLP
jgi:hypothetical protein